ncbi:MAG: helix-hairpin-helix domain-containing protein [Chitinophagales bacterium]|nr:helix-hairpin-helix domain-containing protein [Chitinophagales bacterium]
MRWLLVIWIFIHCILPTACAQEIPVNTEQQLENLTDADQAETEDDSYLQQLEYFRKNPVNLNSADANELKDLRVLTDLQIENLISYRRLFGKLISLYELQAVPAWDINTIKKLLPFITVTTNVTLTEQLSSRFKDGEHSLLFRLSQILEKSRGFDNASTGTRYLGSPQRLFFRYRYSYKNLLQYGVVADKDAGEQFFKGTQRKGFDFYSFHLFARKMGLIQAVAIGDFTVNMGQGLIQWQSLAFKKSAEVLGVKRQSPVLRPYNSAGEFYFHRGAGITIKQGRWETTVFASIRKLSANFATDTLNKEDFVSSFLNSGYHRTVSENEDRNKLTQTSFGGNILYRGDRWHIGLNTVYYQFSRPVQKRDEPYNLYAVNGKTWHNLSVDYSYTYKNLHFFGEAAVAKNSGKAFVNGLLVSVDPRVDISFVQRTIAASYQAVYGNAFTENAYPANETGFYSGISIRPANGWKLDAYADIFKFPWLKYLVDAPSRGTDFLAQLSYTANRQFEIYTRFRNESKQTNQTGNISTTNFLVNLPRQSWRTQFSYKVKNVLSLRNRVEALWYDKLGNNRETGFLIYNDIIYRPVLQPFSGILRLQYFETDGYNSRIYAYENDLLYSYSIPAFFDKGCRYYLLINYDIDKKLSFWLRFAQTVYPGKQSVGSGLDEIKGNRKTELKAQIRWIL